MKNTIINQAITLGFDFSSFDSETTVKEITTAIMDFFYENIDKLERIEDECEVYSNGKGQHVGYGDFEISGEIVTFSEHNYKSPETKVFHSNFVMENKGLMKNMNLYYIVGETDYNAPTGFMYSKEEKGHIKIVQEENA